MKPPKLLSKSRRVLGLMLGFVAFAQAALAAGFAQAIGALVEQPVKEPLLAVSLAIGFGGAMLVERWVAERFAQSFVIECRAGIFSSVIRNRGEGQEARWLTSLVGDLTAIRNYAVRGSVKFWTSILAGVAAAVWFMVSAPLMWMALLPFVIGFALIIGATYFLKREIAEQRVARGRLNRFLIRRVRIEMSGVPCIRGHGRMRLRELSEALGSKAERRARIFGAMEFLAAVSGGVASVVLVVIHHGQGSVAALVGQLSLMGFIASRLLDVARALHARAGGKIALNRMAKLLAKQPVAARIEPPITAVSGV